MQKTYDFKGLTDALGEVGLHLEIHVEGAMRANPSRYLAAHSSDGKELDRVAVLDRWSWDTAAEALSACIRPLLP